MTVSSSLRTARRILTTSIVAAVGATCLVTVTAGASVASDAGANVTRTSSDHRVAAPARKEYRQAVGSTAPARKEYRQAVGSTAPARKEYRQAVGSTAPARKEYRQAASSTPARKEYRQTAGNTPARKEYRHAAVTSRSGRYVGRVLRLVNRARVRHELHRVSRLGCAQRRAVRWSRHLAATRSFKHQSMRRVMRACGARYAGENLGRGAVSPRRLVRLWLDSTPHRRVLLNRGARRVGIGAAKDARGRWVVAADFVRL